MAVTKTLIKAVPYVPNGDLRKAVSSWELTMSFQNGVSGDSDYLYKEYSAHCPNGIIIDRLGASKPAADFTRGELESLCLIEEWTTKFHTLSVGETIEPDTSYTLPS
jgi:hypothetical protein|tara:strand:+ start:725 stop:1045 length:321 start_codon:yes stop_codon:yes gene_type:complete